MFFSTKTKEAMVELFMSKKNHTLIFLDVDSIIILLQSKQELSWLSQIVMCAFSVQSLKKILHSHMVL